MPEDIPGILGTSSLKEVMEWRAAGLLDDEEFATVKKSLLARLARPSAIGVGLSSLRGGRVGRGKK
jgi:hypothetical protein